MQYTPSQIREGQQIKKQAEETPSSFATEGGASFSAPSGDLDKKNGRFAGPGGAYAIALQNDPSLMAKNQIWNQQFMQSGPGYKFNEVKMMLGGGGPVA